MKIGFVGAGFVAGFHAQALQSVREVDLAGVFALNGAEELSTVAKELGVGDCQIFDSVADLCDVVDVVGIFTPNFARLETMQAIVGAVRGGAKLRGIVCEKPLARNLAEAALMVGLAGGIGVPTAYFENQIHMPVVAKARQQLATAEAEAGPVALTRSAEEHGGPHEPWFWDPTRQGGGVWCDMGCHSVAVGWYMLTPSGKPVDFLIPISVQASMALLKWGQPGPKAKLLEMGVDYDATPAEDYVTVVYTFCNPETGQLVVAQATDSWMFDAPGLKLQMEAIGPGYSYGVNTLASSAGMFISDDVAASVSSAEAALEKSQASAGALVLMENEPSTYGYIDEWRDALAAFARGEDALLGFTYGHNVTKLVMAGYMAHERGVTLDLTDERVLADLRTYVPMIQQGRGAEVL